MTHTVHRWNRLCCIHQLSGCSSVCVQPTSCKHVLLNCLNIVWKMTDKRAPPIGAFKLNPLKTPDKISAKVDETTQICDSDITNIENMDKDTGGVDIKPDSHMVKQTPNKASVDDAYSSAFDGVKSVERADSGVMMKMIVSGPPSQVKRQKILPETLLQKVTDLVRQQTMNQDVSIPGEMKDKLLEEDANENIKHTVSEKDTEELKRNSMPCLNTQENVIAAQNSNQYISQPIAQSVDNKLCDSEFTHTANVQYSEQTKDLRDKESLTNMNETYTLADGESCVRLDSCVETGDSFTNKMLEKNRGTKLTERIEKEFEALEGVDEICGPPRSDEPGSAEVKKGKTQMNVNETEISTLGHLTSDGVGDVSDKTELNKEACTKCISDNEIDPFGGLFPENETDSPDDKKAPKDNDEIYNIAPLFSGDLEKWRKRELKKEKKNSWKKKKKDKSVRKESAETGDDKGDKERKKEHRPMPNYFVAIQITNPKIHAGIRRMQEDVVSGNEKLKPALNKLATLHLTMFVVHLQTDDEMTRAKRAMDQCQKKLESLYGNKLLSLDIAGLGNFRNSVVFAKVRSEEQVNKLKEIADIVEDCFLDQEIVSTEKSSSFEPHITVMKLTRDRSFRKKGGIRRIDEALYKEHIDATFGQQYVNTLQLCAMLKKKADSGYYQVEHCVQFGPDISDIADIEGKDKIDLEEVVTDADAKDQEQEHIKMLLDEMIQNVTDPDKNKPFCDDLDTKCLKSNRTEDMETIDSDRIAQHANNDSLPSQDTQYTGIEKKALSADNGSVTVKLEEAISLVVAAESIESTMDKDSDLSPVQHKFNLDISLPRTQEAGETNVVCDSQIDTEVVHERKGRLTDIILTSDSDENRKTCDSPPITNKSMNTEESMNVIVSSETEMIADKSCDMNSTAVKDENSTIVDKGVHKAFPGET